MYLELFKNVSKSQGNVVLTRFYLQFISIHHVAQRPDGVNDGGDVGGVVRQLSLYVHLVFLQQLNFGEEKIEPKLMIL